MRRTLIGLGVLALSLAALPAWADVRYTPPRVTWVGEPVAAVAGQPLAGTLEIRVSKPTVITDLRVEGVGWDVRLLAPSAKLTYAAAGSQTVRLEGTPSDARRPLIVRFDADGVPQEQVIDLSPEAIERALRPHAVVARKVAPDETTSFRPPGPDPARPAVEAGPPSDPLRGKPDRALNDKDDPPSIQARNIRVRGRFVYTRSDGVLMGADGVAVRVYDEDFGIDEHLATGVTDWNGYFDVTFYWDPCWVCDSQPDLYCTLEAGNSKVWVKGTGAFSGTYIWQTGTTEDYGGADLDLGWFGSADEGLDPALHILTDVTRDWRWYLNVEGYDPPGLAAYWPDGSTGAWYSPGEPSMHFSTERGWREDSHAHEYAHHFIQNYAVPQSPDYCNGICDASATDCGHCMWCRETNHDAWSEGWPNWICHVQTSSYETDYGRASMNRRNMESLAMCGDGTWHSAELTEGFLGALLQDIWDSANEDDAGAPGTWMDRLSLGTNEIFDVTDFDGPLNPTDLLTKFKNRYPAYKEQLWETAMNCRYDPDVAIPGPVSGLTSPSHAVGGTSPDPTVQFTWTRATDDWSGPSGYSVLLRTGSAALPDATQDIGDVATYTTGVLAPGTYWFSIRTRDRAGRWDDGYVSYGPFTIRAPEPANLTHSPLIAGWDFTVVPRATNDATVGSVPAPTAILPGNAAGTYINMSGRNTGESATSVTSSIKMYLDDAQFTSAAVGVINAGQAFAGINWGPYVFRGGRHTLEVEYDATDVIAETDETDNAWARQWIWSPYPAALGALVNRVAPPASTAGWNEIVSGPAYYNCDGLRFSSAGSQYWHALWTHAVSNAENYDCRIHFPSGSPDTGFGAYRGYSTRGAGLLDAVLVNRNKAGSPTDWDVGVLNHDEGAGYYHARHVASSVMTFGDSVVVTLPENEMMLLREFWVGATQYGPVSITAQIIEGTGPLTLAWFDKDFQVGDLLDRSASAVADGAAKARIDVDISASGWNGIALYRDPTAGFDTVKVVLEIETTPPDFTPFWAAGWYSPLVPRPAFDATPASVPEPDTLHGNVASTYLNFAVRNQGPVTGSGLQARAYIDGLHAVTISYPALAAGGSNLLNWNYALTLRGGRHTLAIAEDPLQLLEEMYEDNNTYGSQFVWSPLALAADVPVTRAAPPELSGGWGLVNHAPYGLYYDCDGLRMPKLAPTGADGYWLAVATMPGASSNVDVRLHELSPGAGAGFRANLGISSWGTGLSDYMVVNTNKTAARPFDVGVLRGAGTQTYTAELVRSVFRSGSSGRWGPLTLAAGHILHLHEVYLGAGTYTVDVFDQGGGVDWGLTVHRADTGIQAKSTALTDGVVWTGGPGESELATVVVPAAGFYGIAVWKRGAADLAKSGQYILQVRSLAVDVPDAAPARTALGAVYPNPLRASATVAFDLAAEGEAEVEVYDVHGARVRTLAAGRRPAGRHLAVWDGTTDAGRPAAPGVYVLRFSAGPVSSSRKLVKLD